MITLEELAAIREQTKDSVLMQTGSGKFRVLVGLATCGIAAGANAVYDAIAETIKEEGLEDRVSLTQTGCIGICKYEPVVEIYESGKEKVTYVHMTAEKAKQVILDHVKGGKIVEEFVIGAAD